jgi:hypothetical protein
MPDYHYISVELTDDIEAELMAAVMAAGIPPAPTHDFHCTVMYDKRKREIDKPFTELDPKRVFTAYVVSIDVLGDGLVFHLTSKELQEEHRRLREAGYQSPYDGYLPHMSLTYDFNDYDILKLKSALAGWAGRALTFTNQAYGLGKV